MHDDETLSPAGRFDAARRAAPQPLVISLSPESIAEIKAAWAETIAFAAPAPIVVAQVDAAGLTPGIRSDDDSPVRAETIREAYQRGWQDREDDILERAERIAPRREAGPRLVILESPYAGDVEANIAYARACLRDSLARGEAPIASHLLYTQPGVLDDAVPAERQQGIAAGLAWRRVAEGSVVYTNRGISDGMRQGIAAAEDAGLPVEYRTLLDWPLVEAVVAVSRHGRMAS